MLIEFFYEPLQRSHSTFLKSLSHTCMYRVAQKERMFLNLPAISFFEVTSNQKSTFENLVQLTI